MRPRSKVGARIAIVTLVACTVGVLGIGGVRAKQAIAKRDAFAVERETARVASGRKAPTAVAHPVQTTWKPHIEVTGTLRPWREADVGFELGGRLTRLNVQAGDKVHAGAVIAVLDAARAGAQVNQAEAQVRAAEANLALAEDTDRRTAALVESKAVPESQAEQTRQQTALARAQLESARASAQLAKTGAGDHAIIAPFSGLVTRAPTAIGGVVQPGAALVHLEDLSRFRLSATLSEDDATLVRVGSTVAVSYRGRTVTGRVTTVVPSLDQATRRAPIEIEVPNDPSAPLLAWSFVHAVVDAGAEVPAVKVPVTARRPGSQDELFVVQDGKLKTVRAPFVVDAEGMWTIRAGLTPSDTVVLSPSVEAKDGDDVGETALK
jgi:RND family efflux transporter MFP subunit